MPDPPSPEQVEFEQRVWGIRKYLQQASDEVDTEGVAWAIVTGFDSLLNAPRYIDGPKIGRDERDDLLRAVVYTQIAAVSRLPEYVDRSQIALGFAAVSLLAVCLHRPDLAGREDVEDSVIHARVLRNCCSNVLHLERLAKRLEKRRELSNAPREMRIAA